MSEKRLQQLGIKLAEPESTIFQYIPLIVHQNVVYLAGQIPKVGDGLYATGKIGAEVNLEQAKEAARICVLQGLSWLKHYCGNLDKVKQILRMNVYLAVAPGFEQLSQIADSASDLLISIFADGGRHPRSVVAVTQLARNAPVLIELTIAIKG